MYGPTWSLILHKTLIQLHIVLYYCILLFLHMQWILAHYVDSETNIYIYLKGKKSQKKAKMMLFTLSRLSSSPSESART